MITNEYKALEFSIGPYLSRGLEGETISVVGKAVGEEGFPSDLRKKNTGLMFSLGLNIKKYQIRAHCSLGLGSLMNDGTYLIKNAHSSTFGICLVRIFDLSKKTVTKD
jgi:hypothetical protein